MLTSKAKFIIPLTMLLVFSSPPIFAAQPRIEKVVVTGTGLNEQGAIKNAAKAAIQQVVGMYVVSDTLMKNRKLIKEEVLSHSNAYIRSFKVLNKNVDEDGLHEIEASVEVEAGKVVKSLGALNITTKGSIKTEEFVAKVTAKKTGAKEFKDIVNNVIINPFKTQKKIWDLKIHSFDQLEEYDRLRVLIDGDRERLDNFELTPYRIVFSIQLNDEYLDSVTQLCEHSSKEVLSHLKKNNNSKIFHVYLSDIKNDKGITFKTKKTYIFSSYHAKVLKQSMAGFRSSSLLRISLLNKARELYKSAFYWDGEIIRRAYSNRPVTELSGSQWLERMDFDHSKKKYDWRSQIHAFFPIQGVSVGSSGALLGMIAESNYLYLIKNQLKYSTVLYLNLQDIENLGSLQIELKPSFF